MCLFWATVSSLLCSGGSLTKPWILWSGPHTRSGTVREVRGLLVGTEDLHSESEGQRWSLDSTLKLPYPRPQFPHLPNVGNDSISPPKGL